MDVITRFVTDPNYEVLREKYVPGLDRITKKYVLLLVNPNGDQPSHPCYYWKPKKNAIRPYILISVHSKPYRQFIDVFSILPKGIVHEMLHDLHDDCEAISKQLSEFDIHFNEQCQRDEDEFMKIWKSIVTE